MDTYNTFIDNQSNKVLIKADLDILNKKQGFEPVK